METKKSKTYSNEFKEKIIKECIETNKYNVVVKKHKLPVSISA